MCRCELQGGQRRTHLVVDAPAVDRVRPAAERRSVERKLALPTTRSRRVTVSYGACTLTFAVGRGHATFPTVFDARRRARRPERHGGREDVCARAAAGRGGVCTRRPPLPAPRRSLRHPGTAGSHTYPLYSLMKKVHLSDCPPGCVRAAVAASAGRGAPLSLRLPDHAPPNAGTDAVWQAAAVLVHLPDPTRPQVQRDGRPLVHAGRGAHGRRRNAHHRGGRLHVVVSQGWLVCLDQIGNWRDCVV